jgi:Transcriptional regulators of sugar metabolism
MLSLQRRNEIKRILWEKKSVTVAEMAEKFGVSYETVRRDFETLQVEGFVDKTYGGAVLKKHVKSEADYQVLSTILLDDKKKIAKKAAEFIYPGDCIFLDYSTTTHQILADIQDMKLIVMTNSFKVLAGLSEHPNIVLNSTGGQLDYTNFGFFGRAAEKYLSNFHLDKAFVSCRALDVDRGLSDKSERESCLHKAIIDNADSVYLLMDQTKFDKVTYVHTCGFEKITAVITDHYLPDKWKDFFKSRVISFYECVE